MARDNSAEKLAVARAVLRWKHLQLNLRKVIAALLSIREISNALKGIQSSTIINYLLYYFYIHIIFIRKWY